MTKIPLESEIIFYELDDMQDDMELKRAAKACIDLEKRVAARARHRTPP